MKIQLENLSNKVDALEENIIPIQALDQKLNQIAVRRNRSIMALK